MEDTATSERPPRPWWSRRQDSKRPVQPRRERHAVTCAVVKGSNGIKLTNASRPGECRGMKQWIVAGNVLSRAVTEATSLEGFSPFSNTLSHIRRPAAAS
jgi:hypothetical protein